MNTKIFPKSRVCAVDVYPAFEKGLKKALTFAETHNISINTADGKRIILAFCLDLIQKSYKDITAQYPLVLFINTDKIAPKLTTFVNKHLEGILKHLPVPYCGKYSINSPDLEFAAEKYAKQINSKKDFLNLFKKIKIKKD